MLRFLIPDYSKAGAGIDKNAPKKTGIPLLIETLSREFTTLFKLNFICIICCIPIVTIGPAMGALTSVTLKMVEDKPVDWFYDFKEAFKKNWKQSFVIGFLQIAAILVIMCAFLYYMQLEGISYYCMMTVIGIVTIMVIMSFIYQYSMSVLVNLNVRDIIKNSFLLSILNIKNSIITAVVCSLLFAAGYTFRIWALPVIFMFVTLAFSTFFCSFCAYGPIKKNIIR